MKLSIIIPILNEAVELPDLLDHLLPWTRQGVEIVLVDGGSRDCSATLALTTGFRVLDSAPGRALQMNVGAQAASGDVLLFLHADTRLPEGGMQAIEGALSRHDWGRFDVRIVGKPLALRLVAALMNGRSRITGIATGDQALFMSRRAFEAVGGFPDLPLMEDIAICQALKRLSWPACLHLRVATSGRRWETRGVWRTIALMWWLRWRYWLGTSADEIARAYR